MPVVINTNVYMTLQSLGVSAAQLAKLSGAEWVLKLEPDGVKFTKPGVEKKFVVASTKLMAAAKGMASQTDHKSLVMALDSFINTLITGKAEAPVTGTVTTPPQTVQATFGHPAPQATFDPATVTGDYGLLFQHMVKHSPISNTQMVTGDPLPLMDAVGLYAPVRGTDKTSKYFMVAVFDTFRVAARLKGNKLSLRCEGSFGSPVKLALQSLSFIPSEKHWSIHTVVQDGAEASRFTGAMLSGLSAAGAQLLTPLPNMTYIAGKGI
jgi:hypothetical protein